MLIIEDNEMIMSTVVWDITYVGNTLRIDSKKSRTAIQIKFDVNKSLVIFERANYTFNNWHVVIDKSGTVLCSSYGKSQGFRGIAYGDNPNPNFGFVFVDNTKNTGVMLGQGEESGRYNPIIRLK